MSSTVAPAPETMNRDDNAPSSTAVTVQPLTMDLLTLHDSVGAAKITQAYNDGAGAKYCCMCCSLAEHPDGQGVVKYMKQNPSRLPSWGVALDADGAPLGYIAMTFHPMQPMDGLHSLQPGEAYVDQVMVSSTVRGRGVGTKLLEWGESLARERRSTTFALEVLNGNPARKLYERHGLEVKPANACTRYCISPLFIGCFASLPYGWNHCGSVLMTKDLL